MTNSLQEWRVKAFPQALGFSHSGSSWPHPHRVYSGIGTGREGCSSIGTASLEHYPEAPVAVVSWSYHGPCMRPCPKFPMRKNLLLSAILFRSWQ
ncbi:mCG148329 [Mus musculus]|nr:mCG148329 [Mus musculus]